MWKSLFSFIKRDEKDKDSSGGSSDSHRKGKENGGRNDTRQSSGGMGDCGGTAGRTSTYESGRHSPASGTSRLSSAKTSGPIPRSPFKKRGSYAETYGSAEDSRLLTSSSVTNPSGKPLLTTPLLPKIKRVIELNDSLRQVNRSQPSPVSPMGTQVRRSQSLTYGPTHPTRSTPGRLPVVRLQRRPSVHLIRGRSAQSPSTVKVAAPERSMLSSPSVFLTRSPSTSPVRRPAVDTQTVVSALRERSSRKRSTMALTDDSLVEEEYTQIAKRRRQDSTVSTSSSVSMPLMPDKLPDLSAQSDIFSPLASLQPFSLKRPSSAPRRGSVDELGGSDVQPLAKREKRLNNSRILSSLSSYKRQSAEESTAASDSQVAESVTRQASHVGKRTRPDTGDSPGSSDEPAPARKKDARQRTSDNVDTGREPPSPASGTSETTDTSYARTEQQVSEETRMSSPQAKVLPTSTEQATKRKTDVYPALQRKLPTVRPVAIASPADLEQDRKAEEAIRVQAMLAFLDEDEEDDTVAKSTTTTTTTTAITATTAAQVLPSLSTTITTTTTTTSKSVTTSTIPLLNQLLNTPLSTSSHASSTTPLLSSLAAKGSASTAAVTSSSLGSGLVTSVAGLVQSSGVSAALGLVSSSSICSTGGPALTGSATSAPVPVASSMSAAAALASMSGIPSSSSLMSSTGFSVGSLASATIASSLLPPSVGSVSKADSTAGSQPQYTFKPVFGAATSPTSSSTQDARKPQVSVGGFSLGNVSASSSQPGATSVSGGFNFAAALGSQAPGTVTTVSPGSIAVTQSLFGAGSGLSGAGVASSQAGGFSLGGGDAVSNTSLATAGGGGFTLGGGSTAGTVASTSSGFNFGLTSSSGQSGLSAPQTSMGFSFTGGLGATTASATAASQPPSGFNFGVSSSFPAPVSSSAFTFGTSTASAAPTTGSAPFTFGGVGSVAPSSGGFSLGQSLVTGSQQSVSSPFGQSTQLSTAFGTGGAEGGKGLQPKNLFGTPKAGTTPTAVSLASSGFGGFGVVSAPSAQPVFGQSSSSTATATTATAGGFSFGLSPAAPGGGALGFGQPSTSSSTGFSAPPAAAGGFSFGTTSSTAVPPTAGGFNFGQPASTSAGGAGLVSFGQPTSTTAAGNAGMFNFGQTTSTAAGTFSFGPTPSTATSTFSLGQSQPASGSSFNFGQSSTAGFNFGASATTTSASSGFASMSTTPTGSTAFSFGAPATTSTSSGGFSFGAASSKPSGTFGQPGLAPTFGQVSSSQTAAPSPFGSAGTGFSFGGANPSQQPAAPPPFGAPQSQPAGGFSGFGSSSATTGFNFGASSAAAQPAPAFGSGTAPSALPFGGAGQPPAFGSSQSTNPAAPVFGASGNQNSSAGGGGAFVFGAGGGQQQSSGFTFGAATNPGANSGGGFDFSAAVGGGPNFNFGAGGQPNMFTTGAVTAAPKPRSTAIRARRRAPRK